MSLAMPWIKRKLRGSKVFVRVDDKGQPVAEGGRVDILYKLTPGAKLYRAAIANLNKTGIAADEVPLTPSEDIDATVTRAPTKPSKGSGTAPPAPPDGAIVIYTDGACTGKPGPAGIGAVIVDGDQRQEISEYLGQGTNNIAELTAIERALQAVAPTQRDRTVVIHSDSSYSIGILQQGWKAKANVDLVARIRRLVALFSDLRFVKVKGHAGIPENERCDELGRLAIARGE
jgi:ribonuclease HI